MTKSVLTLRILFVLLLVLAGSAAASEQDEALETGSKCKFSDGVGIIAAGENPQITFQQYAALCAPILWFSPD